jgi:zinc transport system substrate-binding protein
MWSELAALLASHPARWMIWEYEPLAATEERLAAMGVGSVVFSPAAVPPAEGDFLERMNRNARELERMTAEETP